GPRQHCRRLRTAWPELSGGGNRRDLFERSRRAGANRGERSSPARTRRSADEEGYCFWLAGTTAFGGALSTYSFRENTVTPFRTIFTSTWRRRLVGSGLLE